MASSVASVKLALSAIAGAVLASVLSDCSAALEIGAFPCSAVLAHLRLDKKTELRGVERGVEEVTKEAYARDGDIKADGREVRRREAQCRKAYLGNHQWAFLSGTVDGYLHFQGQGVDLIRNVIIERKTRVEKNETTMIFASRARKRAAPDDQGRL
jgi:hypothetical protein